LFARFPDASVIGAHVYHKHQTVAPDEPRAQWVADFSGGACVYRREHFFQTGGYVPLAMAYGMEEVDIAVRLHAAGRRVLLTPWLRVYHDTDLAHHADPAVTAASVSNAMLLTYLRYPISCWGVGAAQTAHRIWWCVTHGRHRGVLAGVLQGPGAARLHRQQRSPVPASAVRSFLQLRRQPIPAAPLEAWPTAS
jgi:GT2 family glycosyltransferase